MHHRIFTIKAEKADKTIEAFLVNKLQRGHQIFYEKGMLWMYEDENFWTEGVAMICIRFDFSLNIQNLYTVEFIIGGGPENYILNHLRYTQIKGVKLFSELMKAFCDENGYELAMTDIFDIDEKYQDNNESKNSLNTDQ
jgi:hypothetical protein